MRIFTSVLVTSLVLASPLLAESGAMVKRYYDALKMNDVFEILRDEGIQAGLDIAADEEGISASPAWTARVRSIYAVDKMDAAFRHALTASADLAASEDALAFFESTFGQRVVQIELDARRALSDEAVEDAAREQATSMQEEDPARLRLYSAFIEANDLIDSNVMGALNSNLAFYQGLGTNPLFGGMDERSMLAQVYEQEPDIREEMEEWSLNFSVLAYGVLSEDEMQTYIDVSETKAGQVLNAALFAGFDSVFELQSFELGRAMAEFMVGDDT
ncbi:MAG: hypothetical protein AAGA08_19630 [Pseudomonadota bacterium]